MHALRCCVCGHPPSISSDKLLSRQRSRPFPAAQVRHQAQRPCHRSRASHTGAHHHAAAHAGGHHSHDRRMRGRRSGTAVGHGHGRRTQAACRRSGGHRIGGRHPGRRTASADRTGSTDRQSDEAARTGGRHTGGRRNNHARAAVDRGSCPDGNHRGHRSEEAAARRGNDLRTLACGHDQTSSRACHHRSEEAAHGSHRAVAHRHGCCSQCAIGCRSASLERRARHERIRCRRSRRTPRECLPFSGGSSR
mmetsp:Transcript_4133/g.8961  ORF Transcript_4133/g.8961 Transcript_4133/m.8961 type:complete len:250 (-) Transcript_4133:251-1000(-)